VECGAFVKANSGICGPLQSLSVAKKDSYLREANAHYCKFISQRSDWITFSNQRHLYFWCNGYQTVAKPTKKRNSKDTGSNGGKAQGAPGKAGVEAEGRQKTKE